ncbi:MAG: sigma-70 family RNA polymerase sigma factor [Ekhidna sp.]|nr:sigma-70 family RNA polymerase sigma factor [Ekhidna sp.]MBC6409654.1 sigma-70 family RNA polymerase sigma factor [Ekhidna sp.]
MDEKKLVQEVLSGSDAALKMLIEKYERLVAHMVGRVVPVVMDKEEICQDVFIKVYTKLSEFNFESKLSTWIATIAYRMAVNFAKKRKPDSVELEEISFRVNDSFMSPDEEDMKRFVHLLVGQLPLNYRSVLTMFYLEGFSYPEIVEITGMPEGTVKNYIHRAKHKLKVIVSKYSKKEIALL